MWCIYLVNPLNTRANRRKKLRRRNTDVVLADILVTKPISIRNEQVVLPRASALGL